MMKPNQRTRCRTDLRRLAALFCCGLVGAAMVGCSAGPRNFENENDRLRADVFDLKKKVEELSGDNERLHAALASAQAKNDAASQIPTGMSVPQLAGLEIASRSGGFDTDQDGRDDTVRLYVKTLDQQGRMMPVVATAAVTISQTTPGQQAKTVAAKQWDAKALDENYRSGLTGTHYTLEIELDKSVELPSTDDIEIIAHVQLSDLQHGGVVKASQAIRVNP